MPNTEVAMRLMAVCLLLFFAVEAARAEPWARAYGGAMADGAQAVCRTADGELLLAGDTRSLGASNYDFLLVKVDLAGDTTWAVRFGSQNYDGARSIIPTLDGGFLACGRTYVVGGQQNDFSVVRVDAGLDVSWNGCYGGTGWDEAFGACLTTDSCFVVAGKTRSFGAGDYDFLVLKLSPAGETVWARTLGGRYEDDGHAVVPADDGGCIVAGSAWSPGAVSMDVMAVRLTADGDTVWAENVGPGGIGGIEVLDLCPTDDGGCVVAGRRAVMGALDDFVLLRLGPSGNLAWAWSYGGDAYDCCRSVRQTADAGFIAAGVTTSLGADSADFLVLKLDQAGNPVWAGRFGGPGSDTACAVEPVEGGYLVAGSTSSWGAATDFLAVRLDSTGNMPGCPWWHEVNVTGTSLSLPTATWPVEVGRPTLTVSAPLRDYQTAVTVTVIWPEVGVNEESLFDWSQSDCRVVRVFDQSGRGLGRYDRDALRAALDPGVYFARPVEPGPTAKLVVLR